jgi:hypothetical protein
MRKQWAVLSLALAIAGVTIAAYGRQDAPQNVRAKTVGEVLEGKIKQAAFQYYAGTILGDLDQYLRGVRLPMQMLRGGKSVMLDEAAARAMLKAIAAKQSEKPLTREERTEVIGNIIRTLDESDIRFIGANTATLVFLVRHDEKTKADLLCSLTLYRPEPKVGDWKIIQEITDAEPVPEAYVK